MQFASSILAFLLVHVATSLPSRLQKRADVDDVATVGFATLNGGTTGGSGGAVTTVTTLDDLVAAVTGDEAKIVIISGTIDASGEDEGVAVKVGSNTSVLGAEGATLINVGLRVLETTNVIIRGLTIQKVLASTDAIAVQEATNVWVDSNELSGDLSSDKDTYDGLLDITHAGDFVTVSNNLFTNHWKTSLVGHSDNNGDEDTGHLRVTYVGNWFNNVNSRTPSLRFGTGHVFNNYFLDVNDGINSRDGAQILVENNVFESVGDAIYSTDAGYVVASGNDLGDSTNEALEGTITPADLGYDYTLLDTSEVVASVSASAGATISFSA